VAAIEAGTGFLAPAKVETQAITKTLGKIHDEAIVGQR
jgi:hypothetical protein